MCVFELSMWMLLFSNWDFKCFKRFCETTDIFININKKNPKLGQSNIETTLGLNSNNKTVDLRLVLKKMNWGVELNFSAALPELGCADIEAFFTFLHFYIFCIFCIFWFFHIFYMLYYMLRKRARLRRGLWVSEQSLFKNRPLIAHLDHTYFIALHMTWHVVDCMDISQTWQTVRFWCMQSWNNDSEVVLNVMYAFHSYAMAGSDPSCWQPPKVHIIFFLAKLIRRIHSLPPPPESSNDLQL
jgi:hypothetical protein